MYSSSTISPQCCCLDVSLTCGQGGCFFSLRKPCAASIHHILHARIIESSSSPSSSLSFLNLCRQFCRDLKINKKEKFEIICTFTVCFQKTRSTPLFEIGKSHVTSYRKISCSGQRNESFMKSLSDFERS